MATTKWVRYPARDGRMIPAMLTLPPGTEGTVRHVDDFGGVHVDWDNGSSISAQPNDTISRL